jgi:hypothetical protein
MGIKTAVWAFALAPVGNVGETVGSVGVAIGNRGKTVGSVGVAVGNVPASAGKAKMTSESIPCFSWHFAQPDVSGNSPAGDSFQPMPDLLLDFIA